MPEIQIWDAAVAAGVLLLVGAAVLWFISGAIEALEGRR
jgi:hypothetical protein